MDEKVLESFKRYCPGDGNCTPELRVRTYSNGKKHLHYQCSNCMEIVGQAVSKHGKDLEKIPAVIEKERDTSYVDTLFAIGDQIRKLQKENRDNFFKNVLGIEFESFQQAYPVYLASPFWQAKRQVVLKRDNFICRFCLQAPATAVHHISYSNLGNESDNELISVCNDCHNKIHMHPARQMEEEDF